MSTTQIVTFSSLVPREVFQSGSLNDQTKVDLKEYFIAVKTRYESGEDYPYDLEELVPTVFTRKDMAVEALERDFTQDIDYRLFRRETENHAFGGRPAKDYRLSPLTFEFMAARKNKDIFGLYHRVFHAKTKPISLVEQALLSAQAMFEQKLRLDRTEQRVDSVETTLETIQAALPKPSTHATVKAYAISKGYVVDNKLAGQLGRKCSLLCRQSGIPLMREADEQFAAVNSYPLNILELAFNEIMPDGVPLEKFVLEPEGDFYPVKELWYAVGRMRANERGVNRYLDCHFGWQYQGPDGRWHPTDAGKPHCKVAKNGKLLWNIEAFKTEYNKSQSPAL